MTHYKTIDATCNNGWNTADQIEQNLNRLASKGWELLSTKGSIYIFLNTQKEPTATSFYFETGDGYAGPEAF